MMGAPSTIRPDASVCLILEQAWHDGLNGLTFQFTALPNRSGRGDAFCLRILGAIPHGNRSYYFNQHGALTRTYTESDASKIGGALK